MPDHHPLPHKAECGGRETGNKLKLRQNDKLNQKPDLQLILKLNHKPNLQLNLKLRQKLNLQLNPKLRLRRASGLKCCDYNQSNQTAAQARTATTKSQCGRYDSGLTGPTQQGNGYVLDYASAQPSKRTPGG